MENKPRYRSLFWPILLVGVGIIWLLSNLNIIQPVSVGSLIKFWPVILIVLGIDILFSRQYPWIGAVVGVLAVAGVIVFLISAPKLGYTAGSGVRTETFATAAEGVESVEYNLETASYPVTIQALDNQSNLLVSADVTYQGTFRYDESGTTNKTISMSQYNDSGNWFVFDFNPSNWIIELSPKVPTDININGGSGSIDMDLRGIQLEELRGDFGSGSTQIVLPESDKKYAAEIQSGSGSVRIDLPSETTMVLTLDSGSGSNSVSLPSDAEYRIEVMDDGSGSLSLPDDLIRSSDSNNFDIGAYETDGYKSAEHPILIQILGQGSGSISIH